MHASRKTRRTFAAPLVMTIAAVPACVVASPDPAPPPQPPPQQHAEGEDPRVTNPPPPQPDPRPAPQAEPTPRPTPTPQPQPQPQPQAPDYQREWTVMVAADGTCRAMVPVSCPAKATCNPPPPQPVACPPGIEQGKSVEIFARAGSNDCYVKPAPVTCPQGVACNPPRPRKTPCPTSW